MNRTDETLSALDAWAPNLAVSFPALSYLGSVSANSWIEESKWPRELHGLIAGNDHLAVVEMWRKVLKERVNLPAPVLLLILENMRRCPAEMTSALGRINFRFSNTLANVAHRAASELYEDAKQSFAAHEIDVAIARYKAALSEFRFSIESKMVTDATRRLATGKYATAVAMIGRWVDVSPGVVSRALLYSKESISLGNLKQQTLTYRLELLVLRFDQTGDSNLLHEAVDLLMEHPDIQKGSELVEAEVRYRLALLAEPGSSDAKHHLEVAKKKLARTLPKGSVEEAGCNVLAGLITETEYGNLAMSPRSIAIPKGLLALMTTEPSAQLWQSIRQVIYRLEHLRASWESVPAAALSSQFLRAMVDGPSDLLEPNDLSRYVEITSWLSEKASYNRHTQWEAGAAALSTAKRTGNMILAHMAQDVFNGLTVTHPSWPLPRIGAARVREYLSARSNVKDDSISKSWREAAQLALSSPNYARSNLGGRNEVFAVTDARGFLSETFVFKRTTKEKAEHEAAMLNSLQNEIARQGEENRFTAPRSLAIVEVASDNERRWVHVSQRSAGRLVSKLSMEEAPIVLESVADLMATFHRIAGTPPPGKTAWKAIKGQLKMWSKTLFDAPQAERFVDSLRSSFPENLPLVRKRDGHASNWIVDPAGRIVAIDFESSDFVPVGYDISQLIEDNGLLPADSAGWQRRESIMSRYLNRLNISLGESSLVDAYSWFALTRALRLGTEKEAGKHLRRHAREICGMLLENGSSKSQSSALELLQALSRIETSGKLESAPGPDHRRLSKAMAYMLRHDGPSNGVPVDGAGFAYMTDLALRLAVEKKHLLAVAEHPSEPRFEIRDDRIRAVYGHSLNVVIDAGVKVGNPSSLYHGSSWAALDVILRDGLSPMQRRMVHLTNVVEEALAVGERKGAPIILTVVQRHDEEPVAEGIWVTAGVPPHKLSILNPFIDEAGVIR
ncbi:RNA 2'-phosphotransferase [Stenotrophomonas maltophilia]|uniref:RNA 2'-phosphotransferase n=1 Tax=Stenotrophomonas maltophilia TaxID=40324 RepID=UPI0013DD642B|nr:RNA 2'-phosphotransferase [Stenotrophomonas maltophilia]